MIFWHAVSCFWCPKMTAYSLHRCVQNDSECEGAETELWPHSGQKGDSSSCFDLHFVLPSFHPLGTDKIANCLSVLFSFCSPKWSLVCNQICCLLTQARGKAEILQSDCYFERWYKLCICLRWAWNHVLCYAVYKPNKWIIFEVAYISPPED